MRLPQLERLMSVKWHRLYSRDVNDKYIVSILIDCLVTNYELLKLLLFVPHNGNICIGDIQLRLIFHEEVVFFRVQLVELDQEHSALALELVC